MAGEWELLKTWCDRLLSLQITDKQETTLYGGILCPSCGRIHGRCADAIYPFMFLADRTKDDRYLEGARRLFAWSGNLYRREGYYYNDTNSDWKGITVFAAIALGESLLHHGALLSEEEYAAWLSRFQSCALYLKEHIEEIGGNINYPVTCAHAMAVAAKLLKDDSYRIKARKLAKEAAAHITTDGLLYGEGKKREYVSPKGCRPVDLGYNVEESLPALIQYAILEEDEEILQAAVKAMEEHLEFMLPDGAWDNSWGTRNNKWSYWGSRTSDGFQSCLGLLGKRYPLFSEAAARNTELLRQCTGGGLLYGGPMFQSAGEPPCVHHTFCHAKALTSLLSYGEGEMAGKTALPSDSRDGIKYYPDIHVALLGKGGFRATISDYDVEYTKRGHATGGSVTLLWHQLLGPVLAGTMGRYELVEPNNMQLPRHADAVCLTPRIALYRNGQFFESASDLSAQVSYEENPEEITVKACGVLRNGEQEGSGSYEMTYRLNQHCFQWTVLSADSDALCCLPVISRSSELVEEKDGILYIHRENGAVMQVSCDAPLSLETEIHPSGRLFNPVSGMQALDIRIPLEKGRKAQITISIREEK